MRRRIKEVFTRMRDKMAYLPGVKLFVFFFSEIVGGYRIYRRIIRRYGKKPICVCMHTGTGDMYNIGMYFKSFIEKENIEDYIFLFRGKSERKIGKLFGIESDEILDTPDTWKLMRFVQFAGEDKIDIRFLHHYPYAPQSQCHLDLLEGYKTLTFNTMFREVTMGLPEDCKVTEPVFEEYPGIGDEFRRLGLKPGWTVILSPYSSSATVIGPEIWEEIAARLKEGGYTVATNCSSKDEYPIAGTVPIFFEYRHSRAYLTYAGCFIGARSGLCDIISSIECRKIVLTPRWDNRLLWKGGPGKTLAFYGLKANYNDLKTAVEIEYDDNTMGHIPDVVLPLVFDGFSENKAVKLKQELAPKYPEKVAIALAFNEFFAPYASVTIQSILEFSSDGDHYDIILLNDGPSIRTKKMMLAPFEGRQNFSIRFVDYRSMLNVNDFHVERGYIPITYARIILPVLLRKYSKTIYLDSDMIVNENISELYDLPMGDSLIAAVRDIPMIAWASDPKNVEYENIVKKLKLADEKEYINAGFLVINTEIFDREIPLDTMTSFAAQNTLRWQDQDLFNKLCEGRIFYLPQAYNVITCLRDDDEIIRHSLVPELISEQLNARARPKILHYIGCSFLDVLSPTHWFYKYWAIARKTTYYEMLLCRVMQRVAPPPPPPSLIRKIRSRLKI